MTLIDLAKQCCDADDYLDMGYVCAKADLCYNALRPVGDTLWFGIPYFFNTSENIFFYLHLFLLVVVAITAWHAFTNTPAQKPATTGIIKTRLSYGLFITAVIILNWPTFFHPLSDTPATLLFVEACLLALVANNSNDSLTYFSAGLCLGCAALLRAAYFYPICVGAIAFVLLWLRHLMQGATRNHWSSFWILSFIFPLSFQFFTTWNHTGHWSFLSNAQSRHVMNLHLNSAATGYETQLPQTGIFWSAPCSSDEGLLPAAKNKDAATVVCIMESRLMFYLGSYATETYSNDGARNFLDNHFAEKIGQGSGWSVQGVHPELFSALSPLNDQTASRLFPENDIDDAQHFVEARSLFPLPPGDYRFSVWLWSANDLTQIPLTIEMNNLDITPADKGNSASWKTTSHQDVAINVSNQPQRYSVDFRQATLGYLSPRITIANPTNAWGATLEPAATSTGYHRTSEKLEYTMGQITDHLASDRYFSLVLFFANTLAILGAIFFLIRLYLTTHSSIIVFVGLLIIASLMQCLVIIPEQRYMQGVLSACWLLCCLWLSSARPLSISR